MTIRVIRVGEPVRTLEYTSGQTVRQVLDDAGMQLGDADEVRVNDVNVSNNLDTEVPDNAMVMVVQKIKGNVAQA